jgi:hypothetical protein
MKYSWKPTSEIFPGSSLMTSLLPLPALAAVNYSPFSVSSKSPGARSSGLFNGLVKDPNLLLSDYLKSPEKYEQGVYELLLDLTGGRRKFQDLRPEEQNLLDRSVLDFSAPARKPEPPPPPAVKQSPLVREIEYHEPEAIPHPSGEIPYWWT